MSTTLNSVDLCKKFSSSSSINSFIKFLQSPDEDIEIMFVVFDTTLTTSSTDLISSVYWKLRENSFISLSGNVITKLNETNFRVKSKILEENSALNLVKLFTNVKEDEGPMRDLIESLTRLAQVNTDNFDEDSVYEVYFQSSVIINGKREYPLYILKSESFDIESLIKRIEQATCTDEKLKLIQEHPEASEIFSNDQVYESLRQIDNESELELWEMIKLVDHETILRSTGLTSAQLKEINFKELKEIYGEMVKERAPSRKLQKLVQFHSNLTGSSKSLVNADLLLPLLTCVIIKITDERRNIEGEVKFIERFAQDDEMSGLNGYIITSTNAAIEVIRTICKDGVSTEETEETRETEDINKSVPPATSAFSSLFSSIISIGQMPKALATSISSTLTRSPRSHIDNDIAVLDSFRERMMATNSANDLLVRDISMLLEDYKNLLYILFKS